MRIEFYKWFIDSNNEYENTRINLVMLPEILFGSICFESKTIYLIKRTVWLNYSNGANPYNPICVIELKYADRQEYFLRIR